MNNFGREWMYARLDDDGRLSEYFCIGVEDFIRFAVSNGECPNGNMIRCPCVAKKCQNTQFLHINDVQLHLYKKGFVDNYYRWTSHGESWLPPDYSYHDLGGTSHFGQSSSTWEPTVTKPFTSSSYSRETCVNDQLDYDQDPLRTMVRDVAGPEFEYPTETPNPTAQGFYNMMKATEQPLYDGSDLSTFEAMSIMMNVKSNTYMSETSYNTVVGAVKRMLPAGNNFPANFYQTKKTLSGLGLPVERIHACINHCMIYWGIDVNRDTCKVCNESRYGDDGKPQSIMYYLPLTPRLQRLYQSQATASHMRWHAEHYSDPDIMEHPSDSEAWRHFDNTHPEFAQESRNIRLGLMADGFTPFGVFGEQYSCWPIIVTPYNLPPGMAMKEQFMFLTILIPGPKDPGQLIDVYLQPLIAELQLLWWDGVETFDCSRKTNFLLRAALMWTISDFPAYSMLSGWTTQGKMACPHCMYKTKGQYLANGRKVSWFDSHRKFLPPDHRYRKNTKNFTRRKVVNDGAPRVKTGQEIIDWIDTLELAKVTDFDGMDLNNRIAKWDGGWGWKKRSGFWDLPYWKDNLIRHNLDVMHIEKNCFENIFNTVFDVKGKSKDNLNSRLDVQDICNRPHLSPKADGSYDRAHFVLGKDAKESICDWVKQIKFPDGCVSNMGRCVDMKKNKLFGMKSHDCHVFMQRLIPIAFRLTLEEKVYKALTEFSLFFKRLTSTTLSVKDMVQLEKDIPIIICQLEMHFPPSFFDVMEHLPIHLAYEARIAGPVHYRWMYPCERFLGKLKKSARNKAHVEASIINAYITEEAANFSSIYFKPDIQTRRNRIGRHDDGGELPYIPGNLSIFTHPGRAAGKCKTRWLNHNEHKAARRYILTNCPEAQKYLSIFNDEMYANGFATNVDDLEECIDNHFVQWFENYAEQDNHNNIDNNEFLLALSQGPLKEVNTYPIYFVNGFVFHTKKHSSNWKSANSGVCIKGTYDYTESASASDYYEILKEVIELEYPMWPLKKVVLFRCDWFNMSSTHMHIDEKYNLVSINSKGKYQKYDPFILASQATQVCYLPYPTRSGKEPDQWWAVCKVKARSVIHMSEKDGRIEKPAFQDDEGCSEPITKDGMDVPVRQKNSNEYADLAPEEEPVEPVEPEESEEEEDNFYDDDVEYEN